MEKRGRGRRSSGGKGEPDWHALRVALHDAADTPAILAALARLAWADADRKGEPEIPTEAALVEWAGGDTWWPDTDARILALRPEWAGGGVGMQRSDGKVRVFVSWEHAEGHNMRAYGLAALHAEWLAAHNAGRDVKHPLAPLVRAWLERPHDVDPFRPVRRASLPRLHDATDRDVARLPAFVAPGPSGVEPNAAGWLPGFEPAAHRCPSWLLGLFDAAGGASLAQGRGAPWELRLFVAALCSVPIEQRTGRAALMTFTVQEVADWLHPDGWANRRRDWDRLPAALDTLGTLRVTLGNCRVALVHALGIPTEWNPDSRVVLQVRVPAGAARGARLDWLRLRRYGAESAALYRAYLATATTLDRTARNGAPLTLDIGVPLVLESGKPKRGKGGRIVRNPADRMPHPLADLAPVWTDHDAARFLGFDPAMRQRRADARTALERLDSDNAVRIVRQGRGRFQLYGPREWYKPRLTDAHAMRRVMRGR